MSMRAYMVHTDNTLMASIHAAESVCVLMRLTPAAGMHCWNADVPAATSCRFAVARQSPVRNACRILAMEEKPPMQKQSFAYILGWSQEKIAGVTANHNNAPYLVNYTPMLSH